MSEYRGPELQAGVAPDAEVDLGDPVVAWNFGTRELTEDEYAGFAAEARRDWAAAQAAREADDAYAAWKAASPGEAARREAELEAASRSADPWLCGVTPEPEPEAEIG
jgi:hypothetical protein